MLIPARPRMILPMVQISCDWRLGGENYFEMTIEIPCNTTANVYFPVGDKKSVSMDNIALDYRQLDVYSEIR